MIAVYVFWIHHEESRGMFNFSGRRDIRNFLQLAHQVGQFSGCCRALVWCRSDSKFLSELVLGIMVSVGMVATQTGSSQSVATSGVPTQDIWLV